MPTRDYLLKLFYYKNGALYRRIKTAKKTLAHQKIGCDDGRYFTTRIDGKRKQIRLHQLIWIYHYGIIPSGLEIDHLDQNGHNNDIHNLRLVTHGQNCRNQTIRKGANPYLGVRYEPRIKRWEASIQHNGIRQRSWHKTIQDACVARTAMAGGLDFHRNHRKAA